MNDRRLGITISLLSVGLLLLIGGCADRSSSAGDSDVDWSSFTTMEGRGLASSDLDDLSRKAGFRFVLPSYLPPGVSHEFFLSSQVEPPSPGQGSVGLIWDDGAPRKIKMGMQIHEDVPPSWASPATGYGGDYDVHRIAGILVACLVDEPDERSPTPVAGEGYPAGLTCIWDTEELSFRVQFGWRTESGATPEVTPGRKEEALKVITSMIEDPYIP